MRVAVGIAVIVFAAWSGAGAVAQESPPATTPTVDMPPASLVAPAEALPALPQATMQIPWTDFRSLLDEVRRAEAARAAEAKSCPSKRSPGMHTWSSPGVTLRESLPTEAKTGSGPSQAWAIWPPVAERISDRVSFTPGAPRAGTGPGAPLPRR